MTARRGTPLCHLRNRKGLKTRMDIGFTSLDCEVKARHLIHLKSAFLAGFKARAGSRCGFASLECVTSFINEAGTKPNSGRELSLRDQGST
jgi:hypothetical protein